MYVCILSTFYFTACMGTMQFEVKGEFSSPPLYLQTPMHLCSVVELASFPGFTVG